jgi:c-di-GMP-related signal transduction protein
VYGLIFKFLAVINVVNEKFSDILSFQHLITFLGGENSGNMWIATKKLKSIS